MSGFFFIKKLQKSLQLLIISTTLVSTMKQNTTTMKTLTEITGKTEQEIIALYNSTIVTLMELGASEEEARRITQESFNETLGL